MELIIFINSSDAASQVSWLLCGVHVPELGIGFARTTLDVPEDMAMEFSAISCFKVQ